MYKVISLFLMLGLQHALQAQNYDLPLEIDDEFVFFKSHDNKIHLLKNDLDFVFEKGKWIKNKLKSRSSKRDSTILYYKKGFNNYNFKTISVKNKTYFVLSGGGPVLKLEGNNILRIDNSVDQKNQFGSAVFTYKNSLFMYGGYGFWTFKEYITYFDFSSNQWELFKVPSRNLPHPRWKPIYNLINDKLYVLGGRTNLLKSDMIDVVLKDLFVVDLQDKTIKTITKKVNPKIPAFYSQSNGFEFDDKIAHLTNSTITAFDFLNNKAISYETKGVFDKKLQDTPILSLNDTLAYIKLVNGKRTLSLLNISEIQKGITGSMPIVLDPEGNKLFSQIFFGLLCLFLILFVFKLFSYKDYIEKLIQHDENWLYFSDKKVRITTEQSQVIKLLERNGQFNSIELNKIISKNKKYAKSHLTLLRKNFINDLNKAYNELLNSDLTLISSSKLPKDKRQLLYKTSKEIYKKVSFLKFVFKI